MSAIHQTSDAAKVHYLKPLGVQTIQGDLKDRNWLDATCAGIDMVIMTATPVLSRQPNDSIEATDRESQLNRVQHSLCTQSPNNEVEIAHHCVGDL